MNKLIGFFLLSLSLNFFFIGLLIKIYSIDDDYYDDEDQEDQ
ncbi:hypothetical protein [Gemella morbillorum]